MSSAMKHKQNKDKIPLLLVYMQPLQDTWHVPGFYFPDSECHKAC